MEGYNILLEIFASTKNKKKARTVASSSSHAITFNVWSEANSFLQQRLAVNERTILILRKTETFTETDQ